MVGGLFGLFQSNKVPGYSDPRRAHQRASLATNRPDGTLTSSVGEQWSVGLWDISEGGMCLISKDLNPTMHQADILTLELSAPGSNASVWLKMKLVWQITDRETRRTFIGVKYRNRETHPKGTFLDTYLP